MAARIDLLTPGFATQPAPGATARPPAAAPDGPSVFESLLRDQQRHTPQDRRTRDVVPPHGHAPAAASAGVQSARSGARRVPGAREQDHEGDVRRADKRPADDDAMLVVPMSTPQEAAARDVQVPDGTVPPTAVAADASAPAGAAAPLVQSPTDDGVGSQATAQGGLPIEAVLEGALMAAEEADPVDAEERTILPESAAPSTPESAPGLLDEPAFPPPDFRGDTTVTRDDIASIARGGDSASTGSSPDRGAREDEADGRRGAERSEVSAGQGLVGVAGSFAADAAARAPLGIEGGSDAPSKLPDDESLASQIVQRMRLQSIGGAGTAVVTLDPEYLGAVTINLHVDRSGAMTATLSADNGDVRAWMQAHESVLRQQLAEQGLSLDRLHVTAERPRDREDAADERRRRWQPPVPRPAKRTAGGTFAVVV